jgi:hypothetical protein
VHGLRDSMLKIGFGVKDWSLPGQFFRNLLQICCLHKGLCTSSFKILNETLQLRLSQWAASILIGGGDLEYADLVEGAPYNLHRQRQSL